MLTFNKIPKFCISLAHRADKKTQCLEQFKKHKLTVNWWPGINGKTIHVPELSAKRHEHNANMIFGCMLSHYNLIKFAKYNKLPAIVVFEDDIIFAEDFTKRINYLFNTNGDWDMAYLGGYYNDNKSVVEIPGQPYLFKVKQMAGTHAYIIKAACYDYVLRNLTYNFGIDEFYNNHLIGQFNVIAFLPFMCAARATVSDITSVHTDYERHFKQYKAEPILP